jgi:hypothetical protein
MPFPSQDPVAVAVEAAILQNLGAASDLVGAEPATTATSVIARPLSPPQQLTPPP